LLTLEGQPAPEIGGRLEGLRGRPVLLYFFAEWCGDCKAQAPTLERVWSRYRDRGLAMVAVTRPYDDEMSPEAEKAKVDTRWKEDYDGLPDVPVVVDTEAMIRYGGSATPTFALVDRKGFVRLYAPTRLSEVELSRHIDAMLAE
ncbi:MAG: TlpA disulfide reductase family protein, partial [Thermoanaerobaculia bacterium]